MGDIPPNVQHDLDVEAYAAVVRSFYAGSLTYVSLPTIILHVLDQ